MHHKSYIWDLNSFFLGGARPLSQTSPPVARTIPSAPLVPGSSRFWCLTLALPFTNPVSATGVHCLLNFRRGDCRMSACYWSTSRWPLPTRCRLHVWSGWQSEITALCRLWLCAVAALDKTNDGAEPRNGQIGHRFSLDRNRSDSLRSVPIQSQYQDRCVL